MKLNISRLLSYFAIAVFITGCQKETSLPAAETEKSIAKLSIEKQYAYVREYLKAVATGLAPLFKDPTFIEYLHTEAAKRFDGDNNVLIKKILENPVYGQRINNPRMLAALNAFKGLDGENWYPQIYIPFFNKHEANRKNSASRTEVVEGTKVVIYDGNEAVTTFPIYKYNAQDSLVETSDLADEPYAEENELIVISLNETVNPDGNLPPPIPDSHGGPHPLVNFRIKDLTVKDGKESWIAGASEVHMKALGSTWNHRQFGYPNSAFVDYNVLRSSTDNKGHEIRKIPRGEIGYPIQNINYPLHTNWTIDNYFYDPIAYCYVVFEYDAAPAGVKNNASKIISCVGCPEQGGANSYINFRSSNSAYGKLDLPGSQNYSIYGNISNIPAGFSFLYYDGHQINTNDIQFNTVKY